jgi:cation diffusion facilitator family transporter
MNASQDALTHDHIYLGADHSRNERRVWIVIGLTTAMMVAEIGLGTLYGSMALVADGWHMSTHASALMISGLAYYFARHQARNTRYTFGTGKFGDLAAFASAIVLALVALLMGWESLRRLAHPVAIDFREAILVAVLGLAVNVVSALLLRGDHDHHHHYHGNAHGGGSHGHSHQAQAHDNNQRSAYVHVIADAVTSVLAIAALTLGSQCGWIWLDPLMGIVGGLVIAQWSYSLVRTSANVLLDALPADRALHQEIRAAIETASDRITDLHVWQVGPGHHAAIIALATPKPREPAFYKERLSTIGELSHVTVEVTAASV